MSGDDWSEREKMWIKEIGFLVEDYSDCTDDDYSGKRLRFVGLEEVFEEIARAHNDRSRKIAIHPVGKCLLDWTG